MSLRLGVGYAVTLMCFAKFLLLHLSGQFVPSGQTSSGTMVLQPDAFSSNLPTARRTAAQTRCGPLGQNIFRSHSTSMQSDSVKNIGLGKQIITVSQSPCLRNVDKRRCLNGAREITPASESRRSMVCQTLGQGRVLKRSKQFHV